MFQTTSATSLMPVLCISFPGSLRLLRRLWMTRKEKPGLWMTQRSSAVRRMTERSSAVCRMTEKSRTDRRLTNLGGKKRAPLREDSLIYHYRALNEHPLPVIMRRRGSTDVMIQTILVTSLTPCLCIRFPGSLRLLRRLWMTKEQRRLWMTERRRLECYSSSILGIICQSSLLSMT